MAEEKTVALAVLGIIAVLAVVGLVLLFSSAKTGMAWNPGGQFGNAAAWTHDTNTQYYDNQLGGVPYRQEFGDKNDQALYYSDPGARIIGDYADARYSGRLPGGGSY